MFGQHSRFPGTEPRGPDSSIEDFSTREAIWIADRLLKPVVSYCSKGALSQVAGAVFHLRRGVVLIYSRDFLEPTSKAVKTSSNTYLCGWACSYFPWHLWPRFSRFGRYRLSVLAQVYITNRAKQTTTPGCLTMNTWVRTVAALETQIQELGGLVHEQGRK